MSDQGDLDMSYEVDLNDLDFDDVAEDSDSKKAEWLAKTLGSGGQTSYPLVIDGRDVSTVLAESGGPRFEIVFNEVPPSKIQEFTNALAGRYIDKASGTLRVRTDYWSALEVLIMERMLHQAVVPVNKDGALLPAVLSTEKNPRHALQAARQILRRQMLIRSLVEAALMHYELGESVADDLGNSQDESDG